MAPPLSPVPATTAVMSPEPLDTASHVIPPVAADLAIKAYPFVGAFDTFKFASSIVLSVIVKEVAPVTSPV